MNRSLTSPARLGSLAMTLAAFGVLAAMTTVQTSHVAGRIEVAVRLLASALGLLIIPILILFAFRDWRTKHRAELSAWRNGLGLSSIVVIFRVWLLYWAMCLVAWIAPHFPQSLAGLEWLALFLYSSPLSFILAFFLRGAARHRVITAAFLMWACIQASIYF